MTSQTIPDNNAVICPQCAHQFVAIPVNAQTRLNKLDRLRAQLEAEHARSLNFVAHPDQAPDLFGVRKEDAARYYAYRAEGIAYSLDQMSGL